jgi:ribonuclease P protein component
MRLSQANEDCQGAANRQSPSPKGPQTALCLEKRFPKSLRLRTRQEFQKVQKEGRRITGHCLVFHIKSEKFNYTRLGITVSKRWGSAVARNRFKRWIREIFRTEKHRLTQKITLHVSTRSQLSLITFEHIQADFNLLLNQLC